VGITFRLRGVGQVEKISLLDDIEKSRH